MDELLIEYLIHFDGRTGLPDTKDSFRKSLTVNTELQIEDKTIKYKDVVVNYEVKLRQS